MTMVIVTLSSRANLLPINEQDKRIQLIVDENSDHDDNNNRITDKWPVSKLYTADGGTRMYFAMPELWKIDDADGRFLASRTQVPLTLSWALSIHKAQGQTLRYVKVDLSKAFAFGQAYVEISQAISKDAFQITGFLWLAI